MMGGGGNDDEWDMDEVRIDSQLSGCGWRVE
jgi:hypothetical protein